MVAAIAIDVDAREAIELLPETLAFRFLRRQINRGALLVAYSDGGMRLEAKAAGRGFAVTQIAPTGWAATDFLDDADTAVHVVLDSIEAMYGDGVNI